MCTEPGCERKHHARGFCGYHYSVLLRTNSLPPTRKLRTVEQLAELRDEFLKLKAENPWLTGKEISAKLGVNYSTMGSLMERFGLGTTGSGRKSKANYAALIEDYRELLGYGETRKSAVARLGVCERTLERALKWAAQQEEGQ